MHECTASRIIRPDRKEGEAARFALGTGCCAGVKVNFSFVLSCLFFYFVFIQFGRVIYTGRDAGFGTSPRGLGS